MATVPLPPDSTTYRTNAITPTGPSFVFAVPSFSNIGATGYRSGIYYVTIAATSQPFYNAGGPTGCIFISGLAPEIIRTSTVFGLYTWAWYMPRGVFCGADAGSFSFSNAAPGGLDHSFAMVEGWVEWEPFQEPGHVPQYVTPLYQANYQPTVDSNYVDSGANEEHLHFYPLDAPPVAGAFIPPWYVYAASWSVDTDGFLPNESEAPGFGQATINGVPIIGGGGTGRRCAGLGLFNDYTPGSNYTGPDGIPTAFFAEQQFSGSDWNAEWPGQYPSLGGATILVAASVGAHTPPPPPVEGGVTGFNVSGGVAF